MWSAREYVCAFGCERLNVNLCYASRCTCVILLVEYIVSITASRRLQIISCTIKKTNIVKKTAPPTKLAE
jgi:hypothetical protein